VVDDVADTLTSCHFHGTSRHNPSGVSAGIASRSSRGYFAAPGSSSLQPGMDARCRGCLSLVTFAHAISPVGLLALTFALGIGSAMNGPGWQAVVTEIVPKPDLTAAVSRLLERV